MFKPYSKAEISFDLRREIGHEGSNSTVHIAHDRQLDAEIVIKKILKSQFDSVDRFFEESTILYLSSHPNVVPVHYACEDAESVFIAMPYYARGSLSKFIDSRYLTVREIVVLGCQIASGLHNIHSKKLIHFDVKPDNVLLSSRGEALLSDFGLAQRMSPAGTAEQDRMYFKMLPPEVHRTSTYTHAFDIYQFGLTLYRMCNGNRAFHHQFDKYGPANSFDRDQFKYDLRNGRFPDRDVFPEHIPHRLCRLIKKCLEPDPKDRFLAAIDVANELAQIDNRFDWQYSVRKGTRVWVCQDDERIFRLSVAQDDTSIAEKTMIASGRTTKIKEYCKPSIKSSDIKRFLEENP